MLRSLRPLLFLSLLFAVPLTLAEDGYRLWLRYEPVSDSSLAKDYAKRVGPITVNASSPTLQIARDELEVGLQGLLGDRRSSKAPALLVGTPSGSEEIRALGLDDELAKLGDEGFLVTTANLKRKTHVVIAANTDQGALYGVFAFLRHLQTNEPLDGIRISSAPKIQHRLLNHWDNLTRTVERSMAGASLWNWFDLPYYIEPYYHDYARACASVGINGTVLTNVNANATVLRPQYLEKVAALADTFRPYGVRVYLTARFSAPVEIGGLETADPLNPAVIEWWSDKIDEIYRYIPDFGGFVVKANSEGQPGPQDYGRSHAEGANMLASALGNRGTVIWRAFVYSAEDESDRAKQAYAEFVPLDGQFAENVILQVKNGPVDFQPREPFHPIFGAMPKTRLMLEAQLTKEYLGFATHLAFLAPLWEEVLDADTGHGASVAEVIAPAGMAGVANTGSDRNWTGGHFDQANWYAFGRLAWDPGLASESIAREWAALTFTRDPAFLADMVPPLLGSRQAVVDYMTPLGLAHLMGTGHHYGPAPWVCDLARPEWNPCYYHRADAAGIGFERTATGSDALAQYAPEVAAQWRDPSAMDEDYLLWFHHLPWDFETRSGRTLWAELVYRYDRGLAAVDAMAATWAGQRASVDPERFRHVADFLAVQQREARWWRDASLAYWQSLNGLDLPPGAPAPQFPLAHYRALAFPEAPGQ